MAAQQKPRPSVDSTNRPEIDLPLQRSPAPSGRSIVEFLLILASVYLAVCLESSNQARIERAAAREASITAIEDYLRIEGA
jgi:hypothetical protein